MRVLWLSNKVLRHLENSEADSGAWLDAMAQGLLQSGAVELANIAPGRHGGAAHSITQPIPQWVVPIQGYERRASGLPSHEVLVQLQQLVSTFDPDMIHVWGTELCWGLLTSRRLLEQATLLEMQGLKEQIEPVYAGGMSLREQVAATGMREVIRRSSIPQMRLKYRRWGGFEREMLAGHRFITAQTRWMESHVRAVNSTARIFKNDLALRTSFLRSDPWKYHGRPVLLCLSAYPAPFKGLHVAVRVLKSIKRYLPEARLRIAGHLHKHGIRQDGYMRWVSREIKRLDLTDSVDWLGGLSADELVQEMHYASVFVLPSFIENCSTAMQETMAVGLPVVASSVGGLPSLARNEESALFFPVNDHVMGAYQAERLIREGALAERVSVNARAIAVVRNSLDAIVSTQLSIYHEIASKTASSYPESQ